MLRALRAVERRSVVRGIPLPVRGRREQTASLDARRLADRGLAAAMSHGSGVYSRRNALSGLSRWKIFDNLRRSLVAPALTALLLLGWTVLTPAWLWTLVGVAIILTPPLIASMLDLLRKAEDVAVGQHLSAALRTAG